MRTVEDRPDGMLQPAPLLEKRSLSTTKDHRFLFPSKGRFIIPLWLVRVIRKWHKS